MNKHEKRLGRPVFSNMQRYIYKRLNESSREWYKESFTRKLPYPTSVQLGVVVERIRPRFMRDVLEKNKMYKRLKYALLPTQDHKPLPVHFGAWRGAEIECLIPTTGFYSNLTCDLFCEDHEEHYHDCGCEHDCDGGENYLEAFSAYLQDKGIKRVTVKNDGSIRDESGFFPVEISCLFTTHNRDNLKQLCAVLNDLGAKVNKSCGLHVHFDERGADGTVNVTQAKLHARRLRNVLGLLAQLVPESRRNNNFCALDISKLDGSRYFAINLVALKKFGTLEMRLHSGTTDFLKISHWIDILELIMDTNIPRASLERIYTLEQFYYYYNVPEYLMGYMEHRFKKFNTLIKVNQYAARPAEESDERLLTERSA